MIRRDTEAPHSYSQKVFDRVGINDIQGLLKEKKEFNCGVEAYQVKSFELIDFSTLNKHEELIRYFFCKSLNIPYYVIVVAENVQGYKIFEADLKFNQVEYNLLYTLKKSAFLRWWKTHQTFEQMKYMYNAEKRLDNSLIDKHLFDNSLAWGVNVDGFIFDIKTSGIKGIVEKRIRSYSSPSYAVSNYDPNEYFHGTTYRSGDYASWKILFDLSEAVSAPLFLLTFDTSDEQMVGASKIIGIDRDDGIIYDDDITPPENIFNNNINGLSNWIKNKITEESKQ